ncbi:hypothetical protein C8J57DRAFT_1477660 [Mycena rebaudengoi]|nr:hypothetical protein C8J57DRAFT_1477660 [Mycena rebaudengoi]
MHYFALLILSLAAIVQAVPPSNGFFRILNFENRSVDLHDRSTVDFDPIQSYNTSLVCAHPNLATLWNITVNGGGFKIAESNSGLVMTAWPFQPMLPLPTSPLTLEAFDPTQPRQVFTLQTFM